MSSSRKFWARHPFLGVITALAVTMGGGWLIHREGWADSLETMAAIVLAAVATTIFVEPYIAVRRRQGAGRDDSSEGPY